ncbi:MAG: hypothetical protein ABI624_02470, partial [Casimicrobiaceae bacterium]
YVQAPVANGPHGGYAGRPGNYAPAQAAYGPGNNRYASNSGNYAPRPAAYGPNSNYNARYNRPSDYATR